MRNYQHIERYLNILSGAIYPQPPDPGHQRMLENVCKKWLPALANLKSILDVGCGQGQAFPVLSQYAKRVEGITLGSDVDICRAKGLKLSLMAGWRVSKQWLMLIMPDPKHYGYIGKNHYYVLNRQQIDNLLNVAGWHPIWRDDEEKTELRMLCEKVKRYM
jgi:SAM-dependent methyltransferase